MKRVKPLTKEEIDEQIRIQRQLTGLIEIGMKVEYISRNSGVSLDYLTRILKGKVLPVYKAKEKLIAYLRNYNITVQNIVNAKTITVDEQEVQGL